MAAAEVASELDLLIACAGGRKDEGAEVLEGVRQSRVSQLVAGSSPFGVSLDESAPPQAGEVVRDIRARQTQAVGKIGRIGRAAQHLDEESTSRVIGKSHTHPAEGSEVNLGRMRHAITIQPPLNSASAEVHLSQPPPTRGAREAERDPLPPVIAPCRRDSREGQRPPGR